MNHRTLLPLAMIAFAISCPLRADSTADAAWQKVQDAINSIKSPKERPKNRDEAIAYFKSAVPAFDAAMKKFTAAAPSDPRRWSAKLFDAQTGQIRGLIGSTNVGNPKKALDEIIGAPDADAQTKAEASGLKVLFSSENMDNGKGSVDEWTKLAEEHLKTYPEGKHNPSIQSMVQGIRVTAELKTKPIDLKFTAVDGTEVDLAKMRGKVVLIDFWAVWCGPCVAELPNVIKAYERLHPKGFEIVGISLDQDKAKLEAFTKDKGMTWVQYFDGKGWQNEISSRFGIRSIPAMWLIDKKGMLVSTNVRGKLEAEVEKRLAE
jgi:thiol-disulfide isomerase/thioredoxin